MFRYSGGRRGGGSLAKSAVAAWGGYQVCLVFFPDPKQTCSYWLVKPPFLASLRNQQRGLEVGEWDEEGGTMDAGTTGGVEMERLDLISSIIFIFNM